MSQVNYNSIAKIMAKTIYGTARNDDLKTMEAIANVIINRFQKHDHQDLLHTCMDSQIFPCWNERNYEYFLIHNISLDDFIFAACRRIALKKLKNMLCDNTKGATRFHDLFEYPLWARGKAPCLEAGLKLFYNDVD